MNDFGETLRKEREARGIALDAITRITKISNHHLLALERSQFKALPGGVFNKGIVRGYARVVGLNEEEWVARYLSAYRSSGAASDEDLDWTQFAENAGKARKASSAGHSDRRLRWAGVALLLLALFVASWFVWRYVRDKVENARSADHNIGMVIGMVNREQTR